MLSNWLQELFYQEISRCFHCFSQLQRSQVLVRKFSIKLQYKRNFSLNKAWMFISAVSITKRLCNFNYKDIYFEPDLIYQIKLNGKLLKCQTNWQNFCLSTTYQCIRSYNKTNNIRYFLLCEHRHKKTYESKNLKLKWHSFFMLNKWYLEKVSSKRARSGDNLSVFILNLFPYINTLPSLMVISLAKVKI